MRNRSRILLPLVGLVVVAAFAWLVLRSREPRYDGKSLTEWLAQREASLAHFSDVPPYVSQDWIEASNSVCQIGTNGIPFLLKMLQREDSPLKRKMVAFFEKHDLITTKSAALKNPSDSRKYYYVTDARLMNGRPKDFIFSGPMPAMPWEISFRSARRPRTKIHETSR